MKPDWKDAPEWARWLAQDKGGRWVWFEYKPRVPVGANDWRQGTRPGFWEYVDEVNEGFQNTLERRP